LRSPFGGRDRLKGKVIGGIILILIIGFGFYGYQVYTAMEQIEVTDLSARKPTVLTVG
jgi:hypothetical protein